MNSRLATHRGRFQFGLSIALGLLTLIGVFLGGWRIGRISRIDEETAAQDRLNELLDAAREEYDREQRAIALISRDGRVSIQTIFPPGLPKATPLTPSEAALFDRAVGVNLAGNRLDGGLFAAIRELQHLNCLDLSSAKLVDTETGSLAAIALRSSQSLNCLSLEGMDIGDETMEAISALGTLQTLNLSRTSVGDSRVAKLAKCKDLAILNLRDSNLTDVGVRAISQFPAIRSLDLSDTAITSQGICEIARLSRLERLGLSNIKRGEGPGFADIERMRSLRWLELYDSDVDDRDLAAISRLMNLEYLNLGATNVTSAGITQLAPLSKLRWIDLSYCEIDNDALKVLATLPSLQFISLHGTNLTDECLPGLIRFDRALRHIDVTQTNLTEKSLVLLTSKYPSTDFTSLFRTEQACPSCSCK